MAVLVTGASGLVGRAWCARAAAGGAEVRRMVRRPPSAAGEFRWDPAGGEFDDRALDGCTAVVHLAGESVAGGRWTAGRKRRVRDSRVLGTGLLAARIAAAPAPPRVLVCASAVGYYGDRGEEELDEAAGRGAGFLAETCAEWEEAAAPAAGAGVRLVHLRYGVVLARDGGALKKMLPAFRLGLGGRLGSGRQWMPWLTLEDAVGMIDHAIACDGLAGPVNAVAGSVRNVEFTRALGRAMRRPVVLPVPAPLLRLAFGQMAEELLLAGQRVRPRRLAETGFRPVQPELELALRDLL